MNTRSRRSVDAGGGAVMLVGMSKPKALVVFILGQLQLTVL